MLTAQCHGVQATTPHKQGPPTIRLDWEFNQFFTIIYDATLFLEKIQTQHQWSRFWVIQEPMRKDPEVTKSIISDWESGQGCSR